MCDYNLGAQFVWLFSASKHIRKRRKTRQEDLNIVEGDSKEILIEKFLLLRDVYDELKDENTNLEYEVESLKDYMGEIEEEVSIFISNSILSFYSRCSFRKTNYQAQKNC